MQKVVVASKNPVKLKAARSGFMKMFPDEEFDFIGVGTESGVPGQPIGSEETQKGALNRVHDAEKKIPADFYVGIEGGVERVGEDMQVCAWIIIKSGKNYGKSRTGAYFLPKELIRLLDEGKELGEADDILFKRKNSKQENGSIGILTHDAINRVDYYAPAVIMALIPFRNKDLTF